MSLATQLTDLITRIGTEIKTMKSQYSGNNTGSLTSLNTAAKDSLLAAINEVNTLAGTKQNNLGFTAENTAKKGAISGYAGLDGAGKVPIAQLPDIVNKNKGFFATAGALAAAIPAGTDGDYAVVGATDTVWLWDSGTTAWVETDKKGAVVSVNGQTGTVVIADAIAAGTSGLMTGADKTKLNGIATGATANQTDAVLKDRANHTGTQLAATISNFAATVITAVLTGLSVATATAVAATDTILVAFGKLQAQITAHHGTGGTTHPDVVAGGASGFLSGADKTKLNSISASANNYVHPTADGDIHLPVNGTTNLNKVPKASGTAGSWSLGFVAWSELTGRPTTITTLGVTDAYSKTEIGDIATDFVAAFNTAIA